MTQKTTFTELVDRISKQNPAYIKINDLIKSFPFKIKKEYEMF